MKKVIIYSTPSCTFCNMTKDFLKANNVPYEDYDVGADIEKRKEMVERSGQMGVPVIFVGDDAATAQMIVGFDEATLKELLGL
jgi:glutaredoxin 3